jgi:hypothetical protein
MDLLDLAMMIARCILALALALPALGLGSSPMPAPSATPSPAPTPPANAYRAIALTVNAERLVIAGGGVLRIGPGCDCDTKVAGRPVAIVLGEQLFVIWLHPIIAAPKLHAASDIPARAYLFPVASSTKGDPNNPVTVTISVAVPAQTPTNDDVYVSTERSNWNPAELRMNRVDALHWNITMTLPRGAHLAYRFTRGSFATTERNEARQLPPAHTLVAQPDEHATVNIPGWADIS